MQAVILIYDGSYEGFLCCIFTAYEQKLQVENILPEGLEQNQLFTDYEYIITEPAKAKRVLKKLKASMSPRGFRNIQWALLSEIPGIEYTLYKMLRYVLANSKIVDTDFSHPAVLQIAKVAKQIGRETHRMEAFIRFRLTKDDIYFAVIEPDFNVLPLIASHFQDRYADQKWIIYDQKRRIGLFYDLEKTEYISINLPKEVGINGAHPDFFCKQELHFQQLWQQYFTSTNIKSRANTKLHIQHVPKRYWKYLSEKSPF